MQFENKEGQHVPNVIFKTREGSHWKDVSTSDIFKGKTVIVFSLPGAYTPTCSSSHVPRYNELAPVFKENGVDAVVCMSVNDAFVMDAWGKDQNAVNVRFIPDGNGEFTEAMGFLVDKSDIGFGSRSWRYSMLVKDGLITKVFAEPDVAGDPFEVSDADTMLHHINPHAKEPDFVTVFTREGCPHCIRAKEILQDRGIPFEEIKTGQGTGISSRTLRATTGRSTVPQIFIGGKHIGGRDDLEKYFGIATT